MKQQPSLAIILAGGKGTRLNPLTEYRAKPAVPFVGYRIIDFPLNNLMNSGYKTIYIATQYMPDSLERHLKEFWMRDNPSIYTFAAVEDSKREKMEFSGTADAVYNILGRHANRHGTDLQGAAATGRLSKNLLVFGGDHVYLMDVDKFERYHNRKRADLTISAIPVPKEQAKEFGILVVDNNGKITGFQEKPQENPAEIPGMPGYCLASMGNYVFKTDTLINALIQDNQNPNSVKDFGKNVIPAMLAANLRLYAYNFKTNVVPGVPKRHRGYWRDVGTLAEFYNTAMDFISEDKPINLRSAKWKMVTRNSSSQGAEYDGNKVKVIGRSVVCNGTSIDDNTVIEHSIIGPKTTIKKRAKIKDSFIMGSSTIGKNCKLERVVLEKENTIPDNTDLRDPIYNFLCGMKVENDITFVPRTHNTWTPQEYAYLKTWERAIAYNKEHDRIKENDKKSQQDLQ